MMNDLGVATLCAVDAQRPESVGEAVGVKSEVCEALLAVVEDLAVVLLAS